KKADPGEAVRLLIPAIIVAPAAAWAVSGDNARALSVVNGLLVLFAVGLLASGLRITRLVGPSGAVVAGAVSGAMNVIGGVGGPAGARYALNAGWAHQRRRSNLAASFFGINTRSVVAPRFPGV